MKRRAGSAAAVAALLLLAAGPTAAEDGFQAMRARMQQARDRVYPSLVHILNVEEVFAGGRRRRQVATGSGFFYDARGHIVTNFHVAGRAERLFVTLASRTKIPATLVAGDVYTDLAVLRVDPKLAFPEGNPPFAALGDSGRLAEGDFVMAMGSPLSLSRTISFGIVSCRDRALGALRLAGHETGIFNTWIQTDAAINPGNSGGPLVDLEGEVIGVNTRAGFGYDNIGFAIPSNVVREVVEELLARGKVVRGYLGFTLQQMDEFEDSALAAGAPGVLVAAVAENSPAARAGFRPGDILASLQGEPFEARFEEELPALYRRIAALPVGGPARLGVVTGAAPRTVEEREVVPEELGRHLGRDAEVREWGLTVRAITKRMAQALGLPDTAGVVVTGARGAGPAGGGRLLRDDVIVAMQGEAVKDLEAFEALAAKLVGERANPIRIALRRGTMLDVTVLRPTYEALPDDEEPLPVDEGE